MNRRSVLVLLGVAATVLAVAATPVPVHADEVRDGQWYLDELDVSVAHEVTRGYGVTIGVLDSGVDASHPDLEGNVLPGWSPWPGGEDGLNDTIGHGTAMAGILVGHGHGDDGGDGILGIAPEARVISAGIAPNGLNTELGGSTYSEEDIQAGITWLVDNGADVILTAFGGSSTTETEEVFREIAVDRNIPIIAGAGNVAAGAIGVEEPAAWRFVVSVTGSTPGGGFWDGSVESRNVLVAAPASDVMLAKPGGEYVVDSGTSVASAIVAGIAALMKAQWPDIDRKALMWRLAMTSNDAGDPGPDYKFGEGIVNPYAALTAEVDPPAGEPDLEVNPEPDPIVPGSANDPFTSQSPVVADDGETLTGGPGGAIPWWIVIAAATTVIVIAATVLTLAFRRRQATRSADRSGGVSVPEGPPDPLRGGPGWQPPPGIPPSQAPARPHAGNPPAPPQRTNGQ